MPGGIRTPNLLIRSQKLYPVELQAQALKIPNSKLQTEDCYFGFWDLEFRKQGGQRDSNPQQPEPQSGALPLSYDHHSLVRNRILKFQRFFANKGLDMPAAIH